ncbi:hypothetical protein ACHAXT_001085 [Thalassiosira profunda]
MTAITTTKAPAPAAEAPPQGAARPAVRSVPPSETEGEAKSKFAAAVAKGMGTLLARGHGRERASGELLGELAGGCSPNEEEIFRTMESLGISLEDATRVMTVSSAFQQAKADKGGSAVAAIDELTTRLNLAGLSTHGKGRSRSPSPSPSPSGASLQSTPSHGQVSELPKSESADSLHSRTSTTSAKKSSGPRGPNNMRGGGGRGRKRALAEKAPQKARDGNVLAAEEPAKKKASADRAVQEKMLHAKLAEGKKPKASSAARAKSPEGALGARGKRAAAVTLHAEEPQSPKRPRTRSQTEESFPDILG